MSILFKSFRWGFTNLSEAEICWPNPVTGSSFPKSQTPGPDPWCSTLGRKWWNFNLGYRSTVGRLAAESLDDNRYEYLVDVFLYLGGWGRATLELQSDVPTSSWWSRQLLHLQRYLQAYHGMSWLKVCWVNRELWSRLMMDGSFLQAIYRPSERKKTWRWYDIASEMIRIPKRFTSSPCS